MLSPYPPGRLESLAFEKGLIQSVQQEMSNEPIALNFCLLMGLKMVWM
jgi:hypothetical protein